MKLKSCSFFAVFFVLIAAVGGCSENITNFSNPTEFRVLKSDLIASELFGYSSVLSGNGQLLVVGAYNAAVGWDTDRGAIYLYSWNGKDGWDETAKITASDGVMNDFFGSAIDVSEDGSTIAVSAFCAVIGIQAKAGAVYIYKKNGNSWDETKINASDYGYQDYYGASVALSPDGSTIVVGAMRKDILANVDQGKAYVYRWSGSAWIEYQLLASDGATGDCFGTAVCSSVYGNLVAVSAPKDDTTTGSIHVFQWTGTNYTFSKKIVAASPQAGESMGTTLDMSYDGSVIAASSPQRGFGTTNCQGAVFVFHRTGVNWEETMLKHSGGDSSDYLGYGLGISYDGSWIIAGAIGTGVSQGSAYLFHRTNSNAWMEVKKICPQNLSYNDNFGMSASLSSGGEWAACGASLYDSGSLVDVGAVFVYKLK